MIVTYLVAVRYCNMKPARCRGAQQPQSGGHKERILGMQVVASRAHYSLRATAHMLLGFSAVVTHALHLTRGHCARHSAVFLDSCNT